VREFPLNSGSQIRPMNILDTIIAQKRVEVVALRPAHSGVLL
jgi:hypothetical protein